MKLLGHWNWYLPERALPGHAPAPGVRDTWVAPGRSAGNRSTGALPLG